MTRRVRWQETVLYMKEKSVTHIIEMGSGKILVSLIKRIYPDMQIMSAPYPLN